MQNINDPVKIHWVTRWKEGLGNSYGYYIHNETLFRYVQARPDVEITEDAPVAWWICPPELFREPVPDKINVLFTMFESPDVPPQYSEPLKLADWLVAPSTWVKEILSQHFPAERISVIHHGVEPVFTFKRRYRPHEKPFRWLWCGAPNPRKGWEEVIVVWNQLFKGNPNVELYIKTTRVEGCQKTSNVIVDGRKLPLNELIDLYHSAHGFIFPTRGEGFGLTLAEAMATGLPCIATDYSGVTDFFDASVGWPLNWKMIDGEITFISTRETAPARLATCDLEQMARMMLEVMAGYKKALDRGRRASIRIRRDFTWDRAAEAVVGLVGRLTPDLAGRAAA